MQFIKKIVFLSIIFACLQMQVLFSAQANLDTGYHIQIIVNEINTPEFIMSSAGLAQLLSFFMGQSLEYQVSALQNIHNYRYENGDTLLVRSVRNNKINVMKFFTIIGIDVNGINSKGRSALSTALVWDNYEAAAYLIENNAMIHPSDTPIICGQFLSWLIEHDKLDCIKKLDSAGVIDCNKQYGDGSTPLHCAVNHAGPVHDDRFYDCYDNVDILEYLIQEKHVDLNKQTSNGFTALHFAVVKNLQKVVQLLINAGASQIIKNRVGKTAYNYAKTNELKFEFNDPQILVNRKIEHCVDVHRKKQMFFRDFTDKQAREFVDLNLGLDTLFKKVGLSLFIDIQTLLMTVPIYTENALVKKSFYKFMINPTIPIDTYNQLEQKLLSQNLKINGLGHDMVNKKSCVVTKKFNEHVIGEQDIARIIESYPMLAEGFDLFGLDFKAFLQEKLLDRDLHDPIFDDKKIKNSTVLHSMVIEAEEKIMQELSKKNIGQHHYNDFLMAIELDASVDAIQGPLINYVKKYQHYSAMKIVLHEYIHYSPESLGIEARPSILARTLAMPNSHKKFDLITSLLVDTDLIDTEPVLCIAEDLETLRFLIDHGATNTEACNSGSLRAMIYHPTFKEDITLKKNILQRSAVRTMKRQSNSGLILPFLFLEMNKRIAQDEMIFNAKMFDTKKVQSYFDYRITEEAEIMKSAILAKITEKARQARLVIETNLK